MHDFQFYVSPEDISDDLVIIRGSEFRHCCNVLRKKRGELIHIFDGRGYRASVKITKIFKEYAEAAILTTSVRKVSPNPQIILGVGLVKSKALDIFISQAAVLGFSEFYPILTKHSVKQKFNIDRYEKKVLEAVKQCGGFFLPQIHKPVDLDEYIEKQSESGLKLIALQQNSKPLFSIVDNTKHYDKIALLVGPEGGFSKEEIMAAQNAKFIPVNISQFRLRTELAVTTFLTGLHSLLWQHK